MPRPAKLHNSGLTAKLPFTRLLRNDVDYSQTNLLNKMADYLELQDRDPDFIRKIRGSRGHCNGFATLVGYSLWLETQQKRIDEDGRQIPRDDATWLWGSLTRLGSWNGRHLPSLLIQEDFDRIIAHVEHFQNKYVLNPRPVHKELVQSDLEYSLFDTQDRAIRMERRVMNAFTKRDFLSRIALPWGNRRTTVFDELFYPDRLLRIAGNSHATILFSHRGYHYFYDANNPCGIAIYPARQKSRLIHAIYDSIWSDPLSSVYLEINRYTFDANLILTPHESDLYAALNDRDPLLKAARTGSIKALSTQLAKGREINTAGANNMTALAIAVFNRQRDVISLLLQQPDIDVNFPDSCGNTPLHIAARLGDPEIVNMLLRHKDININAANIDGVRPYNVAVSGHHTDIARILLYDARNELQETRCEAPFNLPLSFASGSLWGGRKIIPFSRTPTFSLPIDDELRAEMKSLTRKFIARHISSDGSDCILKQVELMKERIIWHASMRVDLFFYLLTAVKGKHIVISKKKAVEQHGNGSRLYGSHACHYSLFTNLEIRSIDRSNPDISALKKIFLKDALNATFELPAVVNGFDSHMEGRRMPSECTKECLNILNLCAQDKIDPVTGMNMFFQAMNEFFSSPHERFFTRQGKCSTTAAKIKVYEYEREGTFQAANADLSVRIEYIYMMLRLKPGEIREVKEDPRQMGKYYARIQEEIYAAPTRCSAPAPAPAQ